jgi:hypothetical protein
MDPSLSPLRSYYNYTSGERAITHHAGVVRISGCERLQMHTGSTAALAYNADNDVQSTAHQTVRFGLCTALVTKGISAEIELRVYSGMC